MTRDRRAKSREPREGKWRNCGGGRRGGKKEEKIRLEKRMKKKERRRGLEKRMKKKERRRGEKKREVRFNWGKRWIRNKLGGKKTA